MATLNSKIPEGPLEDKWSNYKASALLVNPANKKKLDIIVVGTGLHRPIPALWVYLLYELRFLHRFFDCCAQTLHELLAIFVLGDENSPAGATQRFDPGSQ